MDLANLLTTPPDLVLAGGFIFIAAVVGVTLYNVLSRKDGTSENTARNRSADDQKPLDDDGDRKSPGNNANNDELLEHKSEIKTQDSQMMIQQEALNNTGTEDLVSVQPTPACSAVDVTQEAILPLQELTSSASSAVLDNSARAVFENLTVQTQTQQLVRDVLDVLSPVSSPSSWEWSLQCGPYTTVMIEMFTVSLFFNTVVYFEFYGD